MIDRQDRHFYRLENNQIGLLLNIDNSSLLNIIYRNNPQNQSIAYHSSTLTELIHKDTDFFKKYLSEIKPLRFEVDNLQSLFGIFTIDNTIHIHEPAKNIPIYFNLKQEYEKKLNAKLDNQIYANSIFVTRLAELIYRENNPNSLKGKIDLLFPSPIMNLNFLTDEEIEVYG